MLGPAIVWIPAFAGTTRVCGGKSIVTPAKAGVQDVAPPVRSGYAIGMSKPGYVYILASKRNGTLYVGVTSDLVRRIWEHKTDAVPGFSRKYQLHTLVYFEMFDGIEDAIVREKRIKEWKRAWKIRLIEDRNPDWRDLYKDIAP